MAENFPESNLEQAAPVLNESNHSVSDNVTTLQLQDKNNNKPFNKVFLFVALLSILLITLGLFLYFNSTKEAKVATNEILVNEIAIGEVGTDAAISPDINDVLLADQKNETSKYYSGQFFYSFQYPKKLQLSDISLSPAIPGMIQNQVILCSGELEAETAGFQRCKLGGISILANPDGLGGGCEQWEKIKVGTDEHQICFFEGGFSQLVLTNGKNRFLLSGSFSDAFTKDQLIKLLSSFTFSESERQVYKIKLTSEVKHESELLRKNVVSTLGFDVFPEPSLIKYAVLHYEINSLKSYIDYQDLYNREFYLTIPEKISEPSFSKEGLEINVTPMSSTILPYLDDPKYCEEQSDCVIRSSFCQIGAYNPYHLFYEVWGCGLSEYEGFEGEKNPEMQAYEGKICTNYEVEYGGADCVKNKCVAVSPSIACPNQ